MTAKNSENKPRGLYFSKALLIGLYLDGHIHGGAYFRNFTVFTFRSNNPAPECYEGFLAIQYKHKHLVSIKRNYQAIHQVTLMTKFSNNPLMTTTVVFVPYGTMHIFLPGAI